MVKTPGAGIQASVSITQLPGGRKTRSVFAEAPALTSPPHPETNATTLAAATDARTVIDARE
jgi:hypothetical protein